MTVSLVKRIAVENGIDLSALRIIRSGGSIKILKPDHIRNAEIACNGKFDSLDTPEYWLAIDEHNAAADALVLAIGRHRLAHRPAEDDTPITEAGNSPNK